MVSSFVEFWLSSAFIDFKKIKKSGVGELREPGAPPRFTAPQLTEQTLCAGAAGSGLGRDAPSSFSWLCSAGREGQKHLIFVFPFLAEE